MGTKSSVIIVCFCSIANFAYAQQWVSLNCTGFDSDSALIDSTQSRLIYGLTLVDMRWLYPEENGYPGKATSVPSDLVSPSLSRATEIQAVRLLAWHEKKIGPVLHTRSALIWCHYLNADSVAEWALLVLSSGVDGQRWVASQRDDQPLMRFSHPPTNEDIQAFLDQLNGIEGRMLSYNKKGTYDWDGVQIRFVGGEVCRETWEEVIGEKPLKLFPKGK